MPRRFQGRTVVKIPVEEIVSEYTHLMNIGLDQLAEMAADLIMQNTLRFGTRNGVPISKKIRTHIRSSISRFEQDGLFIAGAFSPHAHLLEDGHIKWLWGKNTGEFVKGYHFVYDAEQEIIDMATSVVADAIGNLSIEVRS